MSKDYYDILGISKNSSKDEIKTAYKKMARKYHPDISKESNASEKFKEVNEAYSVLSDDSKKSNYDNFGSSEGYGGFGSGGSGFSGFSSQGGFGGFDFEDIFEQFGFGGSSRQRKETDQNPDLVISIEISIDDVYFGSLKEIKVDVLDKCSKCDGLGAKTKQGIKICSKCGGAGVQEVIQQTIIGKIRTQKQCSKCGGAGKIIEDPCHSCYGIGSSQKQKTYEVKIPKGVYDGSTLKLKGKGNYSNSKDSFSDLYVEILVNNTSDKKIDGVDLEIKKDINFIQAILGDEIEIEHFKKTLSVKVPAGCQNKTILRIKGKGLPEFDSEKYGDLYIEINISIPKKITNKQKEILIDYSKTLDDKSFFSRLKKSFF